jgi:hypothetical protein
MPFEAVGVLLMLVATMFALMGHFNSDHKTLVACGLYILGGKLCSVPHSAHALHIVNCYYSQ